VVVQQFCLPKWRFAGKLQSVEEVFGSCSGVIVAVDAAADQAGNRVSGDAGCDGGRRDQLTAAIGDPFGKGLESPRVAAARRFRPENHGCSRFELINAHYPGYPVIRPFRRP
jgi:hypothetical protein